MNRKYIGRETVNSLHHCTCEHNILVKELKKKRIGAGEKGECTISLQIPLKDIMEEGVSAKINSDLIPSLESFTCSVDGKLITVEYALHVLVKHDAWNEFGEGA